MSGRYKNDVIKVILLGDFFEDFLAINKRQYVYDDPTKKPGNCFIDGQLVFPEKAADTDNGLSYLPAKTVFLPEAQLKQLYEGLKEVFEKEGGE